VLATTLIVITIAQTTPGSCEPGACGGEAMSAAFADAVRRVLGRDASVRSEFMSTNPTDEEAAAKADGADGLVELSFSPNGDRAHLHCYLRQERRWLDREIGFGEPRASLRTEISERGRLLGFAVATMFGGSTEPEPAPTAAEPSPPSSSPAAAPAVPPPAAPESAPDRSAAPNNRSLEFSGVAAIGLKGSAGSLGASAGLRLRLAGPAWARLFVAGRTGELRPAQATTRTALLGAGLALSFLPETTRFELGARLDAFVSYFDVTHLSADDVEADRRSRWLPGGSVTAETGLRLTSGTALLAGLGLEAVLGRTEVYTHGARAAIVPPFRAVAEVGFRSSF
jgi:hypothetical protein